MREILRLLTRRERRQLLLVAAAMVMLALVEVAGVGSVAPFLAVAAQPSTIQTNEYLSRAYELLGFQSDRAFLIALGIGVVAFIVLRNAFLALTHYTMIRYSHMRSYSLSKRLLAEYLSRPYTFFLGKNSSELNRDVLAEVGQLVTGYLIPALQFLSRAVVGLAIVGFLVAVNPLIAVVVAVAISTLYGIVFALVRGRLAVLGRKRLMANRGRYQAATEAFTGIKDVKLLGKERALVKEFEKPARDFARFNSARNVISTLPKFALEAITLGTVMMIVIYVIAMRASFQAVIPLIGMYAFAAFRLMPALQTAFQQLAKMRSNEPVVELVAGQFPKGKSVEEPRRQKEGDNGQARISPLPVEKSIELDSITFNYPNTETPAIHGLSLLIRAGTTVGLVGPTGCGKTTSVDILLGLLSPQQGRLLVDGDEITEENLRRWQVNLGYVPQQIYLSDSTLARNIAFGIPEHKIDLEAVERAARVANLHEFVVSELPEGYRTIVGERGVRLSGGQRQRVGIARAVYHNPAVLVLDEATSALDTVTETAVMDAIHNLAHEKTIIVIAHRITTVRECDSIFMLDRGRIVAEGTYDRLLETSDHFRALAKVKE
ncbi:MAG: ABC transporter ATP-binding protein [Spirochaetaceae bacterium]